jgi:hypothetical protein
VAGEEADLAGCLLGRVVDTRGQPVAGATVRALLDARGQAQVQTAADGTFRIAPLPAARYELGVLCDGMLVARAARVEAAAEATPLELLVRERGTVTLELAPAALSRAVKTTVRIVDHDGRVWALSSNLKTRAVNRFELPQGDYVAVVDDPACARLVVPFTVRAGAALPLVFDLEPGLVQVLRLSHPHAGHDLMLSWTWRDGDGRLLFREHAPWTRSGAGTAEMPLALAPGTYRVAVESDRGLAALAAFTVRGTGADAPVALEFRPPSSGSAAEPR